MSELVIAGHTVLFDFEDAPRLNERRWYILKQGTRRYAVSSERDGGREDRMHRFVLGLGECKSRKTEIVDHINGNTLDNRKANLRIVTNSANCQNCVKKGSTSQYHGVCWNSDRKKWQAGIMVNRKQIYLGLHHDEIEAAKAYDRAALEHFGALAKTNFAGRLTVGVRF